MVCLVKPNFERYVEPQRKVADIIVPRGIENTVAISKFLITADYAPNPGGNEPSFHIKRGSQLYLQRRDANHDLLIWLSYGDAIYRKETDREVQGTQGRVEKAWV